MKVLLLCRPCISGMLKPKADRFVTPCVLPGANRCKHSARNVLHEYTLLTCEVEDPKGVLKLPGTPLRDGAAAPEQYRSSTLTARTTNPCAQHADQGQVVEKKLHAFHLTCYQYHNDVALQPKYVDLNVP